MATNLPGLGPPELAPLWNRDLDVTKVGLGREEYFVLTRVDGRTSLRELVLISGLPEGQALTILKHLRQVGAIYFPGEDPNRPPPPEPDDALDALDAEPPRPPVKIDEKLLLEEGVDLTEEQKRAILTKHASLAGGTYFTVLELPRSADKKALRAARDRISREFHPDRPAYFGRRLGSYKTKIAEIFEIAKEAYDVLSDDTRRETYIAELVAARSGTTQPMTAVPGTIAVANPSNRQRAAEIFEEACHHQVTGELPRALREFASVIAMDPNPRYLRRAADAALRAQELRDAEEYGKRAAELDPQNAASHQVYGKVLKAQGRLPEARRAFEAATKLDPGNSHIAAELRGVIQMEQVGRTGGT